MYRAAILSLRKPYHRNALLPLYKFAKSVISERLYIYVEDGATQAAISVPTWNSFIMDCYLIAEKTCPKLDVRVLLPNVSIQGSSGHAILSTECDAVLHVGPQQPSRDHVETVLSSVLARVPHTVVYLPEEHNVPPREVASSSWCSVPLHAYSKVCMGGTFDRLHNGHKVLLSQSALICRHQLTVGVTVESMLTRKVLTELIQPTELRMRLVKTFLDDVKPSVEFNVCAIDDPYGPAVTDREIEAIVATPETEKSCHKINEIRLEKHFSPLNIHLIDFLDEDDQAARPETVTETKISSTKKRLQVLGTLIRAPSQSANRPNVRPYIIGLTGGIGSGKSSLAKRIEGLGAGVVDCDKLGHKAYEPGTECHQQVVATFSPQIPILNADGTINRGELGKLIFRDRDAKRRLTSIVWPEILRLALLETTRMYKEDRREVVVWDAAVLLDAHWDLHCDEVWAAFVPRNEAIKRVVERNKFSEEEAARRVDAQRRNEDVISHANVLLCTLWEYEYTQKQVEKAWKLLKERLPTF